MQSEPLPCVLLPQGKNRVVTDLNVAGLAFQNDGAAAVTLTALALTLLDGDEPIATATVARTVLARETMRGAFIARSELWNDLIFRKGFVGQTARVSRGSTVGPHEVAVINGARIAAAHSAAATSVEIAFEWEATGARGRKTQRFPLAGRRTRSKYGFPLRGAWQVVSNWDDAEGHRRSNFTHFALDFAKLDASTGTLFRRAPPRTNDDVAGFGALVHAPRDGVVLDVHDGIPDNPPDERPSDDDLTEVARERGILAAVGGNYVLLDHEDEEYSLLAHLKLHSATVKKGQRVKRGDPIGRVGNGGNSDQAHLHFQVMDRPDLAGSPLLVEFDDLLDDANRPVEMVESNHRVVHARELAKGNQRSAR